MLESHPSLEFFINKTMQPNFNSEIQSCEHWFSILRAGIWLNVKICLEKHPRAALNQIQKGVRGMFSNKTETFFFFALWGNKTDSIFYASFILCYKTPPTSDWNKIIFKEIWVITTKEAFCFPHQSWDACHGVDENKAAFHCFLYTVKKLCELTSQCT